MKTMLILILSLFFVACGKPPERNPANWHSFNKIFDSCNGPKTVEMYGDTWNKSSSPDYVSEFKSSDKPEIFTSSDYWMDGSRYYFFGYEYQK